MNEINEMKEASKNLGESASNFGKSVATAACAVKDDLANPEGEIRTAICDMGDKAVAAAKTVRDMVAESSLGEAVAGCVEGVKAKAAELKNEFSERFDEHRDNKDGQ